LSVVSSSTFLSPSTTSVERWSLANAIGVLGAAIGAVWVDSLWPLLIVGSGLLGTLVVVARDDWTPEGNFGAANGVTALRVGLLGLLPLAATAGPGVLIGLSLLILAADGLDGWLARRDDLESEFGAFFDMETDALVLLVLCALAAFRGRLPIWILGAGLLRYGFVVLLFLLPPAETTEERSTWARFVFGGMVCALLASFLLYPILYYPLVALATGALVLSFARSLWRIVPRRAPFGTRD
jgi:phosphatidylglycerophosphate synthase